LGFNCAAGFDLPIQKGRSYRDVFEFSRGHLCGVVKVLLAGIVALLGGPAATPAPDTAMASIARLDDAARDADARGSKTT
jgi:hypothetical protein